jgi:predicted phosphoribosyltransferase/dienelactone hydrolase
MRGFRDRADAGAQLAVALGRYRDAQPIVLALPRGGVPVAYEIAREFGAPLDVIVVRKLGVPSQPELAMGAVGEDGALVVNDRVVRVAGVTRQELEAVENRERAEVERRARRFRGARAPLRLEGRTVIVVDDGIATGSTARAALDVARAHGAARVVLAVPVAPPESLDQLSHVADDVVALATPSSFFAVGQWYANFTQVPDEEVSRLLALARDGPGDPGVATCEVEITLDGAVLPGDLAVPAGATGLVVFAHGSGSSRHSPRNRWVAQVLNEEGFGTLLLDLLTPAESALRANVFDVPLLATRLAGAADWARGRPGLAPLRVGYFGASTGAAAALWAAAEPGSPVAAVVSRGGRPDLAGPRLTGVRAPTLLVVGGRDDVVLDLNRAAARELRCEHRVDVVPGATHLFEEPGTLEIVADLAGEWFGRHFVRAGTSQ